MVPSSRRKGIAMDKRLTSTGAKAYQRDDTEWRIKPYSDWHRTLARQLYMLDVDFIEWRNRNGEFVPVGVMEVTQVDLGRHVDDKYLDSIIQRFEARDFQARATRKVASALDTKAYIILFRQDCSEFWVYNLTDGAGWDYLDPNGMEQFLLRL
jgi:hypothetical protein